MKYILLISLFFMMFSTFAIAGITIHYEGKLSSSKDYDNFIQIVENYSKHKKWTISYISKEKSTEKFVVNEKDFDYTGPVKGISLFINNDCEPLEFIFTKDLFFQSYVKTQFAGAKVHIDIIELFVLLNNKYPNIEIFDEGEYWESKDINILNKHISTINKMIEERLKSNNGLKTKIKLPSGRILDLMK